MREKTQTNMLQKRKVTFYNKIISKNFTSLLKSYIMHHI